MVVWSWGVAVGMTANGHGVSFWGDESVEKLDCGDDCTTL